MFDTENFKTFVGPKSAVSYVSGLKRIEQLYDTDIDERFGIDECASLIEKLKIRKKDNSLSETERKAASDMHSHLIKYVAFRNSINSDDEVTEKIKSIIALYKDDFIRINNEERFKWEAIHTYKKVWDIDTENFASMISSAFRNHGTLLRAGNYFPYKMLITFADAEPETVRSLFKTLYNEALPFDERFKTFRDGFNKFYGPQNLNSYQDLHAVSVYLTFEYPEKHYIYKYRVLKNFIKAIGYNSGNIDSMSDAEKYSLLADVCNRVLQQLDDEVKEISMERLDDNCYTDEAFHILAHDIIYFGSQNVFTEDKEDGVLKVALENTDLSDIDLTAKEELKMNISKNTILYGPPGTGKTYNTVLYAVATIENKNLSEVKAEEYNDVLSRYNEYKSEGLIEFTTFHQSYGYEEFIEGIKPETKDNVVTYRVADGVFKKFCNDTVNNEHAFDLAWSKLVKQATNQEEKYDFPRRKELSNNNEDLKTEYYNIGTSEGFTVKRQNSENKLNKQLIYREWLEDRFHSGDVPPNGTGWLIKSYRTILEEMIKHYGLPEHPSDNSNRVFIIDEINRGNISKIFGELITLIEPTKRIGQTEGMKIKLPYSQTMFGVPDNVYILGTMNTADRSIAAIDTALRRRFRFKEIMPDVDVLNGITVEGVIIKNMLDKINKRITALYDREHTIGHSYFLPLKDNPTLDTLAVIFSDDIIPLLQEYFYEDYEKIRLVLGDNKKSVDDTNRFIIATQNNYNELFGNTEGFDDSFSYKINNEAFYNIEAYRKI